MSFRTLFQVSPLGCIGIFLMGGVFSALFGMASVWGALRGLSVTEISAFVAAIYFGGLMLQYPIGWLSDHSDRRLIVLGLAVLGTLITVLTLVANPNIWGLLLAAALIGGVANPVYSLLLAYTNDFLDISDMAAASAGLLFINGIGAMTGPLITGWLMSVIGPAGFWVYIGALLLILALYTSWRRTRRPTPVQDQNFAVISPAATPLAVEVALVNAGSDDEGNTPASAKT